MREMSPYIFVIQWRGCVCLLSRDGIDREALLRLCVSMCSPETNPEGARLLHLENGAPYFSGFEDYTLSLSYCDGWIAAAAAKGPVAVDIERPRTYDEGFVRAVTTDYEWARLQLVQDKDLAFCRLWTRKEAVLKCAGVGIQSTLQVREAMTGTPFQTKTWIHRGVVLTLATT